MSDEDDKKLLLEQVRILGNRVVALDQECDLKREYISKIETDARLFNRVRDERDAVTKQAQRLKQELAGETKRRADAERLVAALRRELAAKESLLERYRAEADLAARLGQAEPLLGSLHEAILRLSTATDPEA